MSEKSPGELAPNFTVQNVLTNESLSLSDFYGKVVILDLFATWCQPCIEAMPFIYEILFSYNPSDLAIISIDVDSRESLELIKSFAKEYNMAWYVTMDNENIVDSNYGTGYIPTMYIINQTGYVHYQEIGFNYDEVIASLNQLISPDSILPILIGIQVDPLSTPLTMSENKISIKIQNVTDNYGVSNVYAEITSVSGSKLDQYPLHLHNNGSIDQNIEVDPILLYQETSIKIRICAEDYKGNTARSSEETLSVLPGPIDEEPPSIKSASITTTLDNDYYIFDIEIVILDDVLVYKIEVKLQEGSKSTYYKVSYKRGDLISNQEKFVSPDPSNSSLFIGKFTIRAIEITNPEDVYVTVTAEDIVERKSYFSSMDDTSTNNIPWISDYSLFVLFLIVIIAYKRNKK
jgi:thiol-disulfide isomerase/thioredoxin